MPPWRSLKKKGITRNHVVFSFVSRRVQPLQHRKHPAFRYEGVKDPTGFTSEPMSHSEVVRRCYKLLDNFEDSLTLLALFWAGNPPEKSWVSVNKHFRVLAWVIPLAFLDETTLLQKNYKTWYCMPPSPNYAAQTGGENEKKRKVAPGSLLQRKAFQLDSGQ